METNERFIGFICPLSEKDSETRKRSDDIYNNVIKHVAKNLGYTVRRADLMSGSNIMQDIILMLRNADIIIADLSELNPNVFYELGVRQAIKGKCINIICHEEWTKLNHRTRKTLPFDISPYRAYEYKREGNLQEKREFEEFLIERIKYLSRAPWEPLISLDAHDLVDVYGASLVTNFVTGVKNHYDLAKGLFESRCKSIFLMQRSSSLVLSAEQGWGEEEIFIKELRKALNFCESFYHIISLDGIRAHFHRKNSIFPSFGEYSRYLEEKNGIVTIKRDEPTNERIFYLKKLQPDTYDTDFKLDRQSRVLITESYEGYVKAVIVQNLGVDQTCFIIEGAEAKKYFEACKSFYDTCELVEWNELKKLHNEYLEVEEKRSN